MKSRLLALVSAALLAGPIAAHAASVLDQANEFPSAGMAGIAFEYRAQTFTVGKTGTLSRFEVQLFGVGATGNAVFEIWNTANGQPVAISGATALATATIDYSGANFNFVGADLAPGIPVKAGDVLAIVYRGGANNLAYWSFSSDVTNATFDTYPLGAPFTTTITDPTGSWLSLPAFGGPKDFNFRTFVDVAVDPAALLQILRHDVTGFGPSRVLEKTVARAQVYYAVADIQTTCAVMQFFDYQVRAIWRLSNATKKPASWKITTAQMDDWLGQSTDIQLALHCPSH